MKTMLSISLWQRLSLATALAAMFMLLTLAGLSLAAPTQQKTTVVPTQLSLVSVNGSQLIVQKRQPDGALADPQPYVIKGVNWSPASPCTTQSQLPEEFAKWDEVDIPLMAAMGVNTIRTFWDFGTGPTATQILDTLYENDIMVIMVVDKTIAEADNITPTVSTYKDHPAILMWAVGNEWDLNHYYGRFPNTEQSADFTEEAAQLVHNLDPNHPVASVLGDIDRGPSQPLRPLPWSPAIISTQEIVNELVPSVEVWGANIYRNATFGGLFGEWQQVSSKPMFVSEFGADSYDHRLDAENQPMQADFDKGLWKEIFLHLSADRSDNPSLGGLIFEWNDEWWKNGNPCQQDISPEMNFGQPDLYNDEEWFGLVNIERQPKQAYDRMKESFLSNSSITLTTQITFSAISIAHSQFFKNEAGFCRKESDGGGGRGLNFAFIDPTDGAIEECRNFDTWYDKQAFVTMTHFISTEIPPGSIILVAIADEAGFIQNPLAGTDCHTPSPDPRVEMGYQALESLGSQYIRQVGYWGSWAMIAIKGQSVLTEAYHDPIYNPPVNGFCQLQSRVSTQITATMAISMVCPAIIPENSVYLPLILKN